MALRCREIATADLPALFELRLSTRENAVTLEELERDYGVTPASLAEAMRGSVRGWLCQQAGSQDARGQDARGQDARGEQAGGEGAGAVVGFAMGDAASGEVLVVAVRPGHEGRGVGARVLARVADWLFAQGHAEIWLRSNADPALRAHGFYRRLGWRPSGERLGADEILRLRRPAETAAEAT